jgi:translation elongation factor EF-4
VSQLLCKYYFNFIFRIPAPNVDPSKPFRALIFDSSFEHFRGAIALILVSDGSVEVGQSIRSYNEQKEYEVTEIGILHPSQKPVKVCQNLDFHSLQFIFRSCLPDKLAIWCVV